MDLHYQSIHPSIPFHSLSIPSNPLQTISKSSPNNNNILSLSSLPFDSHKHSHNWLFTTLLFSLACRMIHWMQLYHTASFISGVKNRNFIFFGYTSLSRPFPTLSTLIKKPFEFTTTSEICVGTITAFIDVIGLSIITSRFFDVRTNYSSSFLFISTWRVRSSDWCTCTTILA